MKPLNMCASLFGNGHISVVTCPLLFTHKPKHDEPFFERHPKLPTSVKTGNFPVILKISYSAISIASRAFYLSTPKKLSVLFFNAQPEIL